MTFYQNIWLCNLLLVKLILYRIQSIMASTWVTVGRHRGARYKSKILILWCQIVSCHVVSCNQLMSMPCPIGWSLFYPGFPFWTSILGLNLLIGFLYFGPPQWYIVIHDIWNFFVFSGGHRNPQKRSHFWNNKMVGIILWLKSISLTNKLYKICQHGTVY